MSFRVLDVGCGNVGVGDVNCDLFVDDVFDHRNRNFDRLVVKGIQNFVLCDGCFLPFRDCVFDEVFSGQVIEHVKKVGLFFGELCRVSKRLVVVESVHYFFQSLQLNFKVRGWVKRNHVSLLGFDSFKKIKLFRLVDVVVLSRGFFPSRFFCLCSFPDRVRFVFVRNIV